MSAAPSERIALRRARILDEIARAAERAGRRQGDVALMAVTKTHPAETVADAARAGVTLFGENRVQEGAAKIERLAPDFPGLEWRLIGPLQTNKARTALQWFQVVESLDRERLAARLEAILREREGAAGGPRRLPVLIEINLGQEASKSGVRPEGAEGLLRAVVQFPHLEPRGLMAVPPYDPDPERSRPHFRRLRQLRDDLQDRLGQSLPELSMGMSHDFGVAVEEGATEVRVGAALFGARGAA